MLRGAWIIALGGALSAYSGASLSASGSPLRNKPAMAFDEARGRLVLFGGLDENGEFSGDTWEWDGSLWVRRNVSGPSPRALSSMTYDSNSRKTVLFGGEDGNGAIGDTWLWDGNRWQQVRATGPPPRSAHEVVYDRDRRRVVMFGGATGIGKPYLNDTWEFDGRNWIRVDAGGPSPRGFYGMVYDENIHKTVLFAGRPAGGDTWTYDGVRWEDVTSPGPAARNHHAMVYDRRLQKVILFGGGAMVHDKLVELDDTWEWDGKWTQVPVIAPSRNAKPNLVFDAARRTVLIYGGFHQGHAVGDLWEWNGRAWHPAGNGEKAPSPSGRTGAAMVYDANHRQTLLFGGFSESQAGDEGEGHYPNALWAWNGKSWRKLILPDGAPQPRGRDVPHLAYDAARGRVVMFGGRREQNGQTAELLSDVWEWDGKAWHEFENTGLPGLIHGVAGFDSQRRHVFVYGGIDGAGLSRKLREWDGTRWVVRDNAGPEDYFAGGGMVDSTGELILMTIPQKASSSTVLPPATCTWKWKDGSWIEAETGPPFGNLQATASSPDGTLYFYQSGEESWLKEPIMYERSAVGVWSQVPMRVSPGLRRGATASYDPRRHRMVLFGGRPPDQFLGDTWEFDGDQWTKKGPP